MKQILFDLGYGFCISSIAFLLLSCDVVDEFSAQVEEDLAVSKESLVRDTSAITNFFSTQPAMADSWANADRDKTYDSLLPTNLYLTEEQAKPFVLGWFNFPQQIDSVTKILGVPHSEEGDFLYWRIDDTAEIAVSKDNGMATQMFFCYGSTCI